MIRKHHLSTHFDHASILAIFASIAFSTEATSAETDLAVVAALKRSSETWDLPQDELAVKLAEMEPEQVAGLVNNVKGILHEMEFQRLENEDGDTVHAALFPNTNHAGVDVQLIDNASGTSWDVQLKATEDTTAISEWIDANPDTEIVVTEEIAAKLNLPSSGISNEELTVRVEDYVNHLIIAAQNDPSIWSSFPALTAASAGFVIFELWERYQDNEISFEQFKTLAVVASGAKTIEFAAIFTALSIPGLNIIVAAYMLGSLVLDCVEMVNPPPVYNPKKLR